jgi:hypothetical protein
MPTTITLNDRPAQKVAMLADAVGQPVEDFVERPLQGLVDADIEVRDGTGCWARSAAGSGRFDSIATSFSNIRPGASPQSLGC